MFIDESGISNLMSADTCFVLSTVIIDKDDFEIIQGYLRLLKRKFLLDDLKTLHATDLFERTYRCYRRLKKPRNVLNGFTVELSRILTNIPYHVGLYQVNKTRLKQNINFPIVRVDNLDLPYEKCSMEAIFDFTSFLKRNNADGEIVIESRMMHDSQFVGYFDKARTRQWAGGVTNHLANDVKDRINCLIIANKHYSSGGLEITDLCSYLTRRKEIGDPKRKLKINFKFLELLFSVIKKKVYVRGSGNSFVKVLN